MRAAAENYRGIEYIRISSLPSAQKEFIHQSLNHKLIINILKQDALLNDCLQYRDYIFWYENVYKSWAREAVAERKTPAGALTLVFK